MMEMPPWPLEKQLRTERLKRQLSELSREELQEYTERLIELCSKLTHQSKHLLEYVVAKELGIVED